MKPMHFQFSVSSRKMTLLPGKLPLRLVSLALPLVLLSCSHLQEKGEETDRRTFARFVPERSDDFAWENDEIAFRAYGPALRDSGEDSGFDAWLKRVPYPIVDKWYAEHLEGKSYHTDHGEGYDPYKVGASRGCGGLGLWIDGEWVTSNVFDRWEIVTKSPEKTTFILHYEWKHAGDTYSEAKRISIELGDRLFRSTSTFRKNGRIAADLPIAIGLVRHQEDDLVRRDPEAGWMAVWETIDGSGLGTGVVIEPQRIGEFLIETGPGELDDHAIIVTKTDDNGQVDYYAGYGWERAGGILTPDDWTDYLNQFAKKLE